MTKIIDDNEVEELYTSSHFITNLDIHEIMTPSNPILKAIDDKPTIDNNELEELYTTSQFRDALEMHQIKTPNDTMPLQMKLPAKKTYHLELPNEHTPANLQDQKMLIQAKPLSRNEIVNKIEMELRMCTGEETIPLWEKFPVEIPLLKQEKADNTPRRKTQRNKDNQKQKQSKYLPSSDWEEEEKKWEQSHQLAVPKEHVKWLCCPDYAKDLATQEYEIPLWQFMMMLLANKDCTCIIRWTQKSLEFIVTNMGLLTNLWGISRKYKVISSTALKRAITHCVKNNFIKRRPSKAKYAFPKRPRDSIYNTLLDRALTTFFLCDIKNNTTST